MAEQDLNGAQVGAGFKKMCGEAMAQNVDAAALADAGLGLGLVEDGACLVVVEGPLWVARGEQPGAWLR